MAKSKLFDTKIKVGLWLLVFLVVKIAYQGYFSHNIGPSFGKSHLLLNIFPSSVVVLVDNFMDIAGFIAGIWLIILLFRGFVGLSRKKVIV